MTNNHPVQKKDIEKQPIGVVLNRICKYIFCHKVTVILAFLLMVLSNVFALAGPKLSGKAVDAILGEGNVDFPRVTFYCLILIVFYLLSALMSWILSALMVSLGKKISYTLRKEVFSHLCDLPVGYFDQHSTGDIISRISYDIDTISASISNDLLQIGASIFTVVGSFFMMLTISPLLVSVFCLTVPISILFTRYKTKRIRPLFKQRSAKLGELNGYAEEMLSGHKTIKIYSNERVIVDRFDQKNEEAVTAYYNADYHASVVGPTVNFINNISLTLITLLGGIFYMLTLTKGEALPLIFRISPGDVSAVVQYSRKFSGPINEFANILSEIQSACAAAGRVFKILDEEAEKSDSDSAEEMTQVQGNVRFDRVNFGYVPERLVLRDFSLEVKKGQTVAIVGATGSGKTTIVNLLMRFYDPDTGTIRMDGREIQTVTRKSLRHAYTMVLQDTWLFSGTIYENIVYGCEDATMEEVISAAKAARIHSFIEQLPNGYHSVLTDDGINISKGQKQLITIARAMLPKSPILILDEATSNVDSRTEILIQQAIHSLMENRTSFVIAHRLSTIQNADVIVVMNEGRILETGTHRELLEKGGYYSSLYHSQFEG